MARTRATIKEIARRRVNEVVSRVGSPSVARALSQNTCTRYLSSLTIVSHGIGANGPAPLTGLTPRKSSPKIRGTIGRPACLCRAYPTSSYSFLGTTICRPRIRMPTGGFSSRGMARYLFFCPTAATQAAECSLRSILRNFSFLHSEDESLLLLNYGVYSLWYCF